MANMREESKENWKSGSTVSEINAGSLQRIADATELMASNFVKLQNDYKYMREDRDRYQNWYFKEQKRSAALKGWIRRLKNK